MAWIFVFFKALFIFFALFGISLLAGFLCGATLFHESMTPWAIAGMVAGGSLCGLYLIEASA